MAALGATPALSDDRALLIGVSRYEDPRFNLPGVAVDIGLMQRLVIDLYGFAPEDVHTLQDGEATRAGIVDAVETWLIGGTQAGDRVFLFFGGHGLPATDDDGDEDDGLDEAIAPFDIAVRRTAEPGPGVTPVLLPTAVDEHAPEAFAVNLIRDDEIGAWLDALAGRHIVAVFDNCFSGTNVRNILAAAGGDRARSRSLSDLVGWRVPRARGLERVESGVDVTRAERINDEGALSIAWSASGPYQFAWETASGGGVFTTAFVDGLRDQAGDGDGDGIVTNQELLHFVQRRSQRFCQDSAACRAANAGRLDPQLDAPPAALLLDAVTGAAALASTALVATPSDPAELRLALETDGDLSVGAQVRMRVESPIAGQLTLIDIDPEGAASLVFPNRYSEAAGVDRELEPALPLTLPTPDYGFAFRASKAGDGTLIAVVSETRLVLEDLVAAYEDAVIEDLDAFMLALRDRLDARWPAAASTAAGRVLTTRRSVWASARLDYRIAP